MKTLVIIPTTKIHYETGFSAPLCWLFSNHIKDVKGIYSYELDSDMVKLYDTFIIELNWYLELYEFTIISDFIKTNNKNAIILFGGLFSSLKYKEIIDRYNVDYFIKGDNEIPIKMFLDGNDPRTTPNFTGKDFENEITYKFKQEDFKNLDFNLDWFPSYFSSFIDSPFLGISSSLYVLPMIITSKGGCTVVHNGCEYCMGAYHNVLKEIYAREPLVIDNNTLIGLINKIEKKYKKYTILFTSDFDNYNFKNCAFEGTPMIEISTKLTPDQVSQLFSAYKSCVLSIPIYEEGQMGSTIINYKKLLELEDKNHKIFFPAYSYDKEKLKDIPENNILFTLDTDFSAEWAHWNTYTDFEYAFKNSRIMYEYFKKKNYPVFSC